MISKPKIISPRGFGLLPLVLFLSLCLPGVGLAVTLGLKDAQGKFVPKVNVTLGAKEVTIKKVDPREKFDDFSLTMNAKNTKLTRNLASLQIEWIDASNKPTKAVPLAGKLYDVNTKVFRDSLVKSIGIKLIDKGAKSILTAKSVSELFTIAVDEQPLLPSEAVTEQDRTVRLGAGRDVSINIDKTSVVFNESNAKPGEIINVDNKSGADLSFEVDPVDPEILYCRIVRIPGQEKVPEESWGRFNVAADAGFMILLIPYPEPEKLLKLDGQEITIKVFQGDRLRDTRRIPIRISEDLKASARKPSAAQPSPGEDRTGTVRPVESRQTSGALTTPRPEATGKEKAKYSMFLWILQIANLALLAGIAIYTFFFILPKMQVLEDRLTKNEMFIHNSREAIREELDHLKEDLLQLSSDNPIVE
jgi:hypothetical protein